MDNKTLPPHSLETLLPKDNVELHHLLFSTNPELGELPAFEPIEDRPGTIHTEEQHLLSSPDPRLRDVEEACKNGDLDRASAGVQQLLQTGIASEDLQVCLLRAVQSGKENLVEMLLSVGVPVGFGTVKTAIAKESVVLLTLFLEHGWNINEEEAWCIPPLLSFTISIKASESLIGWFLSNGADPNAVCKMDITPMSTAVAEARYPTVKRLFDHCPATTVFRGQLLHWAAARRVTEDSDAILRLVLDRCKTNINSVMYEDHGFSFEVRKVVGLGTALHEAARSGRASAAHTLIENGADISIRDSRGNTALEVAERECNFAVADALRTKAIKA